ncbi:TonB-dependent receptor [Sphingomonas sp. BT-65]|uniref:TonB-dependent receptor plug domain-containing protein n=1 Tax=Sphingomonas sp. BT-65 TaxID=2989821 RepID=UPI0022364840|nr:TonB-dependent receptor [Sphingomonas sp. BT-65]MCW4460176.1 TonB-dependent receptor [Sphingomonas sp. BT-65]
MRSLLSSRKAGYRLAASFTAIALAGAAPAFAQDAPQEEAPAADEASSGETVVITGSRIQRPEFATPNPIQAFDAETIEQSGETNITQFLADSPALLGSSLSSDNAGSNAGGASTVGGNYLDLRNLGTNRTLVLVDGRRHVAGIPGSAAVDINSIPLDLIQRVDVLTGGASAVYGADGVSGVVNFIMKRDFEGLRLRGQAGISERGDAGNRYIGVTAGKNFAGGRGNVTLSYEYSKDDRFSQLQRLNYGRTGPTWRFVANQDDPFDADPNTPDYLPLRDLRWADTSPGGAFDLDYDFAPDFTGEGKVYDPGTYVRNEPFTIGGDSTLQEIYFGDTNPESERHVANLLTSFEVSPALRLFAEGKYARSKASTLSQPVYDLYVQIYGDNYYLNQRFGSAVVGDALLLGRDHFDFGVRRAKADRETIRTVVGADGEIGSNLNYEFSYTFGQTKTEAFSQSRVRDRYYAAIDAVSDGAGGVTCRINRPGETLIKNFGYIATQQYGTFNPVTGNYEGAAATFSPGECVPLNIFGAGSPSQEALDFVFVDDMERVSIRQHVVSGSIRGNTESFFKLPGGPVAFAVGAEYRSESTRFDPSEWTEAGLLLDSSQAFPDSGKFDVKEVFGEIDLPILRDLPFAHILSIGGAVRFSDYSTIGNTTTWSINGVYSPIRDITFRGTLGQAVRAPNLGELFNAPSGTYQFIPDPCGIDRITDGTATRQANCTAILSGLGIDPTTFDPAGDAISPENTSLLGRAGGNRELQEESARTWTAGVVLRPRFIPGLQLAVDWYDISIRQAINTPSAQELAELCVDQPTIDNVYCANLSRDPTTGYISNFLVQPANVASFDTEGLDVVLNYRVTPGSFGTFNLRMAANYLHKLEFIPTPGAEVDDDRLESAVRAPEFSGTADLTWIYDNISLNYGINYFSKTLRYSREQVEADPDITSAEYMYIKPRWEHELQLSVNVNDNFTFYAGANNLFDSKPDVGMTNYPVSSVGRYLYAGFKAKVF